MEIIRKPLTNLVALLVAVVVATLFLVLSPEMSGLGGIALPIVALTPFFFGLLFAGAFFLVRFFTKDYAWMVTAIGVITLLILAFSGVEVGGPLS